MNVLGRDELVDLINRTSCLEGTIIKEDLNKDYYKESSIQSCSVDLHIGEMYVPEVSDTAPGGKVNPLINTVIIEPGQSLLVRTEEKLKLPDDIGGICFAPARYSLQGLLIVNIGHIDPGFEGKLHFTVINLGKERMVLQKNKVISTLLLFKLSNKVPPFGKEETINIYNHTIPKTINDSLPGLANTFMDFENKTQKIVSHEIHKANFTIPIIVAIISIFLTYIFNSIMNNSTLSKRVDELEGQLKITQQQKSTDDRLNKIEDTLKENNISLNNAK